MSLTGSAIIHAPFLWTDRGNNYAHGRKKQQQHQPLPLSLDEPLNETSKTAVFPSSNPTPGFSVNTTRALTIKHKKMRNRQRKNKDNEVMATMPPSSQTAPVNLRPKHLDLFEALGKRGPYSQTAASDYCIETLKFSGSGSGLEGSNAGRQSPGPGSDQVYRHMGYNEYMVQAAVRSGGGKEISPTGKQHDLAGAGPSYPRQFDNSINSMEVCVRMSSKQPLDTSGKERRPKIQVTIPKTQSRSYFVVPHTTTVKERPANRRQNTVNTVSPPSTTSGQRSGSEIPAPLSIVSPLSIVEMPKPRRPFSKFSFEEISIGMSDRTPLLSKSASSDSSDDTGDLDDKSSNYSPRSSVSSLTSDPVVKKPVEQTRGSVAFSVISPTAAGVFDSTELNLTHTKKRGGVKSATCLSETIDRNKPLPPEPSLHPVKPLAVSRATSMRSRGKAPAPLQVFRQASFNVPRSRESQFLALRSKYTPADLDALDDAFQKSSPPYLQPPLYGSQQSPTLSQAELALEAHLGTISEAALQDPNAYALMHQPLQISRGPMHMEPSRKPPSLPSSIFSMEDSRKKFPKRVPTHVALQMRADRDPWGRPISTMPVHATGSISKAHRILGRTPMVYPMERNTSADSNWSSSDSHKAQKNNAVKSVKVYANSPIKTLTSSFTSQENLPEMHPNSPIQPPPASPASRDVSSEGSDNPNAEESSVPDAAFEEVRRRLELLSPRDDASQIFLAFHEKIRAEEVLSKLSPHELPAHVIAPQELPAYELSAHDLTSRQPLVTRPQPLVIIPQRSESPKQICTQYHRPPPIEINAVSELGIQRQGCQYETSIRSTGSIAMSEIPDIYASLPSPRSVQRQSMTPEEFERMISAEAAEQVLLRILENLDNLQDLFNTATVSRGFYRTFKRHELPLMKNALYGMSPAAWELREMSPPRPGLHVAENPPNLGYTPSLYLQHYMRDMYIMIALKSMILVHCQTFLRADTITALAGGETVRNSQIDDAFWRVWTFCRLFGFGTNREDDIIGQMDWLKGGPLAKQQKRNTSTVDMGFDVDMNSVTVNPSPGFAQGNSGGLSAEDLYDMTEIWTCLGVLVRGFQGKRKEAREYGIFDKADITAGNVEQEDVLLGRFANFMAYYPC